jgi:predicted HNH restriction endonuclease
MKNDFSQKNDNPLQFEEKIVWLEDIEKYPWVRVSDPLLYHERKGLSDSKLKEFRRDGKIVVGYADLSDDAPSIEQMKGVRKHFKRRIFIVKKSDYEVYSKREDFPSEAVITKSLEKRFQGVPQRKHLEYLEYLNSKTEVEVNRVLPDEEITKIIPNEEIIAISPDEIDTIIPVEEITAIFPDEIDSTQEFREGAIRKVLVNAYERDPKARQKCIDYYGLSCSVCNFNFGQVFGELGEGFIHVHHLRPISEIGEEYVVDPIEDLRPVCPNCHAMIHRRSPPLSIQEIKNLL